MVLSKAVIKQAKTRLAAHIVNDDEKLNGLVYFFEPEEEKKVRDGDEVMVSFDIAGNVCRVEVDGLALLKKHAKRIAEQTGFAPLNPAIFETFDFLSKPGAPDVYGASFPITVEHTTEVEVYGRAVNFRVTFQKGKETMVEFSHAYGTAAEMHLLVHLIKAATKFAQEMDRVIRNNGDRY